MLAINTPIVALVGNPNTGKTTLFNTLAGMRQRVGNYPGVTVETKKGQFRHQERTFEVIDLPGTYSLAPRSPDEMVAVDVILGQQKNEAKPDVVISIVDASNLERHLYLTTQVLELGVPVVVALNMIDVAESQGIRIDATKLSEQMGVPVVPIQANRGRGTDDLCAAVSKCLEEHAENSQVRKAVNFPEPVESEVENLKSEFALNEPPFVLRRSLFDIDGETEKRLISHHGPKIKDHLIAARQRLTEAKCPVPAVEARHRYGWIRQVTTGCIEKPNVRRVTWTDRLDHVLTHRVFGTLIFLALMFLVFQSIFSWAGPLMDWIDAGKGALAELVEANMSIGPLRSLIVSGIIEGVGGVIIFLPQIVILFGFVAILEDCGYMARAAFLMDKLMAKCGLSGKSFIPMLSSVACAVPGIMAARVIENPRDRLATILVAPLMSCSARMPVYVLFIAAFLSPAQGFSWWIPGVTLFAMYMIGFIVAPLVAWLLKGTLIRGETPVFVMEMPTYKFPSFKSVGLRMFDAGWMFVRRAGTLILASMIVIWALLYFPNQDENGKSYEKQIAALSEKAEDSKDAAKQINELNQQWRTNSYLGKAGKAIEPTVEPLGWDWRIGMAALASFPAREVFVGTMGIIYSEGDDTEGDSFEDNMTGKLQTQPKVRKVNGSIDGNPDELKFSMQKNKTYTVKVRSEEFNPKLMVKDSQGNAVTLKSETKEKNASELQFSPKQTGSYTVVVDSASHTKQGDYSCTVSAPLFSVPVALSVMVFFALCCQCVSTLAIIRRETNSWFWTIFTFVYMTVLAYVGAFLTYQIGNLFV